MELQVRTSVSNSDDCECQSCTAEVVTLSCPGYFITLNLGTPATSFKVQLDTASADTWVASTSCTDCGVNDGDRAAIGSDTSQSLVVNDTTWEASYSPAYPLDGAETSLSTAQGTMAKDLLSLGGGLSMENFPFGLATTVSDTFSASQMYVATRISTSTAHLRQSTLVVLFSGCWASLTRMPTPLYPFKAKNRL